jgi:hypothetical protein
MGHTMGAVHVMHIDRQGKATFDMRPFTLMKQGGVVSLGRIERPKADTTANPSAS